MLKVSSSEDVYLGNLAHGCYSCQVASCTPYCHTVSAYLCNDCDKRLHAADPMALSHQRVWICTACENAPAVVTCSADAASLCISCDVQIHSVNALARHHIRVPILSLYDLECSFSCTNYDDQLPGPMFDMTGNEIAAPAIVREEIDENETDSWLLLEPDNTDNQTPNRFSEQFDECMDVVLAYNKYQRQEQCTDQQLHCVNYPGDSGRDSVVPVQTFEALKESQQEEQQLQQQQKHQQLQSVYFDTESRGSKAAFINTPSSSLSVPMLLITTGILPNATSNIPNSYSRFPTGSTDLFPDPLLLMPLPFPPMNGEEKVLRYREKRKARTFKKKIRYSSRKAYAETRPRVKGRFTRKTHMDIDDDHGF
ncbi:hypothetical protein PTKIN_Ptkin05aG0187100 [Pterospermum kingtungense]